MSPVDDIQVAELGACVENEARTRTLRTVRVVRYAAAILLFGVLTYCLREMISFVADVRRDPFEPH